MKVAGRAGDQVEDQGAARVEDRGEDLAAVDLAAEDLAVAEETGREAVRE